MLEWESGATGVLVASLSDPAGYERFEIFGDRGAVRLEDGYDLRVTEHDDAQRLCDDCPDEYPELTHEWRSRRDRARALASGSTASSTRIATSRARCSTAATPLVDGEEGTQARRARERDLPVVGRGSRRGAAARTR